VKMRPLDILREARRRGHVSAVTMHLLTEAVIHTGEMLMSLKDDVAVLVADVARQRDVNTSAVVAISGLKAQVAAIAADTEDDETKQQLQDLHAALDKQTTDLANAIANPAVANATPSGGTAANAAGETAQEAAQSAASQQAAGAGLAQTAAPQPDAPSDDQAPAKQDGQG
jgi:chromosome condensin MukBEF ATPase and DNA-binding subunit MukB